MPRCESGAGFLSPFPPPGDGEIGLLREQRFHAFAKQGVIVGNKTRSAEPFIYTDSSRPCAPKQL
jgi:hypothetical protein